jgi:hypothetical protein
MICKGYNMKDKVIEIVELLIGLRKFLIICALYIIGVVFRIKNLISGAEMVDMMKNTTIAFMASNGIERATSMIGSYFDYQNAGPMIPPSVLPNQPSGPLAPGPNVNQEAIDAQVEAKVTGA